MSIHTELLPDPPPAEPFTTLASWLEQATKQALQPNPNAMVLATATQNGRPSARVVLCKAIDVEHGYLVFYTNYQSRKGRELQGNPRVSAVMHWDHLHRQVRVEGIVATSPAEDSDTYFASRPWQSRIGAWASQQSQPIGSRQALLAAVDQTAKRFSAPNPQDESSNTGASSKAEIPRPPHWGGYRLWADAVELWSEGSGRIHDRILWTRELTPASGAGAGRSKRAPGSRVACSRERAGRP